MILTVEITADELDTDHGGTDTDTGLSLREAIIEANAYGLAIVVLPTGTYSLTITGAEENASLSGDLDITGVITIQGDGAGMSIIDAGGDAGILERVLDVRATGKLTVDDLSITGGRAGSDYGGGILTEGIVTVRDSTISGNIAEYGGGIYNYGAGTLTVVDSTISGNSADDGGGGIYNDATATITTSTISGNTANDGGGIYNDGTITITNSTISGNSADEDGGGVYNSGTATITNSTISENSADHDDGGGGGIYNPGTVTITNSTISLNSAADNGGGIRNDGTATITNSTISGNSSGDEGGGIHNSDTITVRNSTISENSAVDYGGGINNDGTVVVTNSTISGNTAEYGGALYNTDTTTIRNSTISGNTSIYGGGGIYNADTLTIANSIVTGNTTGGTPDDFYGDAVDGNNNLIGDADTAGGLTHGTDGNIVGNTGTGVLDITTVLDTTLADNGGPTLTHALVAGSLAINAGDDAVATDAGLTTDQRGTGFDRVVYGTVDIGAFEFFVTPTLRATLDDSGNLLIEDIAEMGRDNQLTVRTAGPNLFIISTDESFDADVLTAISGAILTNQDQTLRIPLASITGTSITIDAGLGNDELAIDHTDVPDHSFTAMADQIRVFVSGGDTLIAKNVTLVTDDLDISTSIEVGTGTVTIRQQTDDQLIDLGGADAAGTLGLTDAELDFITAGTLVIGDGSSGAITVSSDIDLTDGNAIPVLRLNTGAGVTSTAGGLAVSSLEVEAGGSVTLDDSDTAVSNLAASVVGGLTVNQAGALTVTSIQGLSGIVASGDVSLTSTGSSITVQLAGVQSSGAVTISANGDVLSQDGGINSSNGSGDVTITSTAGAITVQDSGVQSAGVVTVSAMGDVSSSGSGINNSSGTGAVTITSTAGAITLQNSGVQSRGAVTVMAQGNVLSQDSGIKNSSGSGDVTISSTAGTITVRDSGVESAGEVTVSAQGDVTASIANTHGTGAVTVTSSAGGITLINGAVQSRGEVTVTAQGDVLSQNSGINNSFGMGDVTITSHGGAVTLEGTGVRSAGEVAVSAQGDVLAKDGGISNSNGTRDVTITSAGGTVTLQGSGVQSKGTVTVSAAGNVLSRDGGIVNNSGTGNVMITSTAGGVTLQGSGAQSKGSVTVGAAGDVLIREGGINNASGTSNVTITSSAGAITVQDVGVQSTGAIQLSAANDISIGAVVTNATGTSSLSLTSTSGGITTQGNGTLTSSRDITLTADGIELGAAVTADRVFLETSSSGLPIDLGTESVGKMSLTDAELDLINASDISIGASGVSTGDISVSAIISRPSITRIRLNGDTTFAADSGIVIQIGGTEFDEADLLAVIGELTVDPMATLTFTPVNDFVPTNGDMFFPIFSFGQTGAFADLPENAAIEDFLGSGLNARINNQFGEGEEVVVTVDATAPTLLSFERLTPTVADTNADTLVFRATFDEGVRNLDADDFTVNGMTTASVTSVDTADSGAGLVWDITLSGGDLAEFTGSVGVDLDDSQDITDFAANALPNTEPATDETFSLDNTAPVATSFTRKTPTGADTNADTLVFLATFSEDVTGVDAADFSASGTTGTISVSQVSASTYDVTISSGDLASLDGVVGLNLAAGQNIVDLVGNALPNNEPTTDETYSVDNTAPVATSFTRKAPVGANTNADTLVFLATFSEGVSGVDANDFVVTGTTATISVSQLTASTYDVTISGGDLATLDGTVGLDFAASPTITDLVGNTLSNTEPTTDETYSIDNTAPTADIVDITPDPRSNDAGVVSISTSEVVIGVDIGDFALTLNGSDVPLTGLTVSGSDASYTIDLSTVTGDEGTYVLTLNSAGVTDLAGNSLAASASDTWQLAAAAAEVTDGNATAGDVSGVSNENLTLFLNSGKARLQDSTNTVAAGAGSTQIDDNTIEFNTALNTIVVEGGAGDDTLTIDLRGGNPVAGNTITFNGGDGGNDTLIIIDENGTTVISGVYTPDLITGGSGTIEFDVNGGGSLTINFTGLEPVEQSGVASFDFVSPGSEDVVTVTSATGSGNEAAVNVAGSSASVTFESLTAFDVTSLTIDLGANDSVGGGSGADSLTISSGLDSASDIAQGLQDLTIDLGASDGDTLTIDSDIDVPGTLSVDGFETIVLNVAELDISNEITGTNGIDKQGNSTLILSGDSSFTGASSVTTGTLQVDGSTAAGADFTVQSGTSLTGNGSVGGAVSVVSGGTLSPGVDGTGILGTGSLTLASGATLPIRIAGVAPGTEHDQVSVTGSVDLGGATLTIDDSGFTADGSESLILIDNDGSDAVTGIFDGLPEGTLITIGGLPLVVTYQGGDGNDVAIVGNTVSVSGPADPIREGDDAVFTISLLQPAAAPITAVFSLNDGSATQASGDFAALAAAGTLPTVSFAIGEQTKTINVATFFDGINEPDEDLSLTIEGVFGAAVVSTTDNSATATITGASLQIVSIPDQTISAGTGTVTLTVAAATSDENPAALTTSSLPSFVSFVDNGDGTGVLTIDPAGSDAGSTNSITVTATDSNDTATTTFDLDVVAPDTYVTDAAIHRINSGGGAVDGFASDRFANTGNLFTTRSAIDISQVSGVPAALFQSTRWDASGGAELNYSLPVTPGDYEVRLYFAEIYGPTSRAGGRVFDVSIEGQQVLDDFDVFTAAGGANRGIVRSFNVTSDGTIDIDFGHVVENPNIMGIEIIDKNVIDNSGPDVDVISPVSVPVNGSQTINVSASDVDGDAITLSAIDLPDFASFTDNGDGTGSVTFNPAATDDGAYPIAIQATSGTQPLSDVKSFVATVTRTEAVEQEQPAFGGSVINGGTVTATDGVRIDGPADPVVEGTAAVFTVSLDAPAAGPVVVLLELNDGTATLAGNDFAPLSANGGPVAIRFEAGEQAKQVSIDVIADNNGEIDEAFSLSIIKASGTTIDDANSTATATIAGAVIKIAPTADQTVAAGTGPVTIEIAATSTDGQPATLTADSLPAYATFTDNGNGTATITFDPSDSDIGSGAVSFTATDSNTSLSGSFNVEVVAADSVQKNESIIRINAAGGAVGNFGGDRFANTGNQFSTRAAIDVSDASIPEGTPAAIFQTTRWDARGGAELSYNIPVAAGDYQVRLYFAEIYGPTSRVGARVFNVDIEGQRVLSNFDVFAEAGAANKGIVRTFDVASDGTINIKFGHVTENPNVMAIEIIDRNTIINTAPVVSPVAAQSVTPGESLTIPVTAVDSDEADLVTLAVQGLPSFASFVDNGDGTGEININPATDDEGDFAIAIQATSGDQNLTDTTAFELALNDLIGSGMGSNEN